MRIAAPILIVLLGTAAVVASAPLLGWWSLTLGVAIPIVGAFSLLAGGPTRATPHPVVVSTLPPPTIPDDQDPAPARRKHIVRESFPSAREDYRFLLTAIVCWRGSDPADHRAETIAVLDIRQRARKFLERELPEEHESVRHHLAVCLGDPVTHPRVSEVWAEEIHLDLPQPDAERLGQLSEVRKKQAAREEERELERHERDYLGEDALADPGRALVWWLARNPEQIEDTVERIGTLSTLSSAATGAPIPQLYLDLMERATPPQEPGADNWPGTLATAPPETVEPTWSTAVRAATAHLDDEEREVFVDRIAKVLTDHQHHVDAERLRDEFAVGDLGRESTTTDSDSDEPHSDGDEATGMSLPEEPDAEHGKTSDSASDPDEGTPTNDSGDLSDRL